MYTFSEMVEILEQRFSSIPNVSVDDITTWLTTSFSIHGANRQGTVPDGLASLIMLHAEADGVTQVALRTSHYFKFTDKDEEVDKSMISDNYRKSADMLWDRYNKRKDEGVDGFGGSRVKYMRRLDRDFINE